YCDCRLHAYTKSRSAEDLRAARLRDVIGLLVAAAVVALLWVNWARTRERKMELSQLRTQQAKEHAEKLLLEEQLRVREASRHREELDRRLLEQSLETARHEKRAADAERSTLELKSQLYASIGIMAGSYAHNIKNLLVRP